MAIKTYNPNDYISEHFSFNELCCPCCHKLKVDTLLLEKMEQIRASLGVPISVTSCYRCQKHNSDPNVRGAKKSAHLYSYGIDWNCHGKVNAFLALEKVHSIFGNSRWGIYQSRKNNRVFFHTGTDYHVNNSLWISRLVNGCNSYTYYTNYEMLKQALLLDKKLDWKNMNV